MDNTFLTLALLFVAFFTAFAALLAFSTLDWRKTSQLRRFSEAERDSVVFIFENEALLDATPAARQLLDSTPRHGTAWAHLASLLAPRFPRLNEVIRDLAEVGTLELRAADGAGRLRAEWHDGVARVTLDAADATDPAAGYDRHSLLAMTRELETLRASAETAPYPQWREDRTGVISWCNRAYLELADEVTGVSDIRPWPPAKVFGADLETNQKPAAGHTDSRQLVAVAFRTESTRHWFEITETPVAGGDRMFTALPADRLVRAETSRQEFVTTLTKTFAALPIGLAIFDRARELSLFNPALMDLTLLPAQFLISKPGLSAFLDRLREARMIPEPKDYKSWRQQMSELESAAQNGTYEETWSLPTGQTYRVTGRPQPDGAVALLFEDISAEITVTRRFRAELETGQAALDALPQAVAVFTSGGVLSISNAAYARLWDDDPSTALREVGIRDALQAWQTRSAPTPAWDELRAFVSQPGRRGSWRARITLTDGRTVMARATPLPRGATLVDFTLPMVDAMDRPSPSTVAGNAYDGFSLLRPIWAEV